MKNNPHKVIIAMGSQSDWKTLKFTSSILTQLKIKHLKKIISAHRTPKRLYEFAESAHQDGIKAIIAGAGGSAHLPGMIAAITHIPVIGVPIESKTLKMLETNKVKFKISTIKTPNISSSKFRLNFNCSNLPSSLIDIVKKNNLYESIKLVE